MRLVFILYSEDRDLLPSRNDARARELYESGYSVRGLFGRLTEDAALNPDTMDERRGAWGRLLALFRLIHKGHHSHFVQARGGKLFDPDAFPFLEGREGAYDETPRVLPVSDGCILRILEGLMTLKGPNGRERLSYRSLDVEQIGSVYEIVMGFKAETAQGHALAIRAGKNNRTPVFVDLDALLNQKGKERIKYLKEEADRGQLSAGGSKAVEAAKTVADLAAALDGIVDERASPQKRDAAAGTPILQPTDERRRTGSHYTPRSLTEPIVRHALEPAFDRLGPDATPEQILDLKVCDPAMGSGAFLVEACRSIGERLVKAWDRWPAQKPAIPDDEDEDLHARRLVAQRCLYGVDKNPLATDLAKLSLWLATLARDHEFTFLDHALKSGDSLVGLTEGQIKAAHWDTLKPGLLLFRQFVEQRVGEVMTGRAEIQTASDDTARVIQEARHRSLERHIAPLRAIGDAVIAAFFAEDKPKTREKRRAEVESWLVPHGKLEADWDRIAAMAATLKQDDHPLTPFHWEIEFPEVFARANGGFDAIVGNPPFAGKNTISAGHHSGYPSWLQNLHVGAHGNADLVAHFFRRAFGLLRQNGAFGLLATNTIGQGDTRESGLKTIIDGGGSIFRAERRLEWPGEAAVIVSVVHVRKGSTSTPVLNGHLVRRISAYLFIGDLDGSPYRLAINSRKVLIGSYALGSGFLFDDRGAKKGECEPLDAMKILVSRSERNSKRIIPFLGGSDVTTDPKQESKRFIIDFRDLPLQRDGNLPRWIDMTPEDRALALRNGTVSVDYPDDVAADWPDLLEIVKRRVLPQRLAQDDQASKRKWWKFKRPNMHLYNAMRNSTHVVARSLTSTHFSSFAILPNIYIFDQTLLIFVGRTLPLLAILCSRLHEDWVRTFAGTFKDDGRYNIEDCFETFPFPPDWESIRNLEIVARQYHDHRAALMVARNEGLTKTYNRFHDPTDTADDIKRLRELHAAVDRAVLEAYGWDDLAARAEPRSLDEEREDDHTYQGRLFWPSDFRDEVIDRLLALNAARHAEEVRRGVAPGMRGTARTEDEDDLDEATD
jgi:N-6 DNA Methylase